MRPTTRPLPEVCVRQSAIGNQRSPDSGSPRRRCLQASHQPLYIRHYTCPAFTIIELIVVLTLLGILATITITVGQGVRERGRIARAKADLAILATSLESYKSRYGDYPWTGEFDAAGPEVTAAVGFDNAESRLFNALVGVFAPDMTPIVDRDGNAALGKVFIEGAKFTFENLDANGDALFPDDSDDAVANAVLDPWDRRYQYFYRDAGSPDDWENAGYVLYSVGPDGEHLAPPDSGFPDFDASQNLDNIYAGRN